VRSSAPFAVNVIMLDIGSCGLGFVYCKGSENVNPLSGADFR
jgi:hypothetical protein